MRLVLLWHSALYCGINLRCIRLGLGRWRGDEQTAVGSWNKNKREEAQYHHLRLITLEHSIINCVRRPPGLFTWDWEVFALGLTDWLCRPSAASSPQLRFVFCFLSPPFIFFFSFHYEPRVRFIPHRLSIKVRDSVCGIYLSKHQHLCDPQLWQTTEVTDTKTVVFCRLWWNCVWPSQPMEMMVHSHAAHYPVLHIHMYVKSVLVFFK